MYPIDDLDVIEVGSGLGSVLLEMRRRGIRARGVEPSGEWCGIIRRRLREEGLPEDCIVEGIGEKLPFESASADLVVTMQVLEHVDDPERVMAEVDRVLRPGGKVYISAPNYMAFFEDHYRVPWLPVFGHTTGGWYLRAIGRDPEFYRKHVNNLTYLQVARAAKRLGWIDLKLRRHAADSKLASVFLERIPRTSRALYHVTKFLRAKMNLHFEKPVARQA
jgi:arabinofuranan 3-O-arabinosyltransferase